MGHSGLSATRLSDKVTPITGAGDDIVSLAADSWIGGMQEAHRTVAIRTNSSSPLIEGYGRTLRS
ncbi:MAG: hypothetical protein ABI995_03745 [Acidobacteriota bacterium]